MFDCYWNRNSRKKKISKGGKKQQLNTMFLIVQSLLLAAVYIRVMLEQKKNSQLDSVIL